LERVRKGVNAMHECKATRRSSVTVNEKLQDQTVWKGWVEVFYLSGHPQAKRCYAWSYRTGNVEHFTEILEIPPVSSPETAVWASVVSDIKRNQNEKRV